MNQVIKEINTMSLTIVETLQAPPLRIPDIQAYLNPDPEVIETQEVRQPDGSLLWVYQIKWPQPKGNTLEEIKETVKWANEICKFKLDSEDWVLWGDYTLVHGRNNSFLNLLIHPQGECQLPELNECLLCLGGNRFQYRFGKGGVITINQDPSRLEKRYKEATLSKFKGGQLEIKSIQFTGMIQNLVINHRGELNKFFED
jgi:hypothetical protein